MSINAVHSNRKPGDAPPDAIHAGSHTGTAEPADHESGTRKSYLIGFLLSVVLTAIPFWLVMSGVLGNRQATALTVMGFAVVQIAVHMVFFLHMNSKSQHGWTLLALIFTAVLVLITLSGSLWVMYHLNVNMMPGSDTMSQMP